MKQIRIVETAPGFAQGLAHLLIEGGAVVTSDPNVFQVEDDIAEYMAESYHGIRVEAAGQKNFMDADENQDVIAWLRNYKGDFEFYVSVKTQLEQKQSLSPKQVDSIRRAIAREASYQGKKESPALQRAPINHELTGKVIVLGKFFAKEIATKAGYSHPHYAMEVLSVEAETDKALKLNLKMVAFRMGRCCCCGLTLTDPQSIAIGIGPECASKREIPHGELAMELLQAQLMTAQTVNTWLPKSAIKERHDKNV